MIWSNVPPWEVRARRREKIAIDTFKAKGDLLWAAFLAGWWERGEIDDEIVIYGYSPEEAKVAYKEWVEENNKNGNKANSSGTAKQEGVREDTAPSSK